MNQPGDEPVFSFVGQDYLKVSEQELRDAITLLCKHLNVTIYRRDGELILEPNR